MHSRLVDLTYEQRALGRTRTLLLEMSRSNIDPTERSLASEAIGLVNKRLIAITKEIESLIPKQIALKYMDLVRRDREERRTLTWFPDDRERLASGSLPV